MTDASLEWTNSSIRAEMARRALRQADLAAVLGISQGQVSARMSGAVEWRLSEILQVAALLKVHPSTLLASPEQVVS